MEKLECISPIDGRYRRSTEPLAEFFSESALSKYRTIVEIDYFIFLSKQNLGLRQLTQEETNELKALEKLSLEDCQIIKDIEVKGYKNIKATNHDVKAIEYYLKDKLETSSLKNELEWIHFALTSEDINNISYALMISEATNKVILPTLNELYTELNTRAIKYSDIVILARTHGNQLAQQHLAKSSKSLLTE